MFPLQTNPDPSERDPILLLSFRPLSPFYSLRCFETEQVNPVSTKKLMKNENTAHTILTADVYFSASIYWTRSIIESNNSTHNHIQIRTNIHANTIWVKVFLRAILFVVVHFFPLLYMYSYKSWQLSGCEAGSREVEASCQVWETYCLSERGISRGSALFVSSLATDVILFIGGCVELSVLIEVPLS